MTLEKIISITGKPGLYKILSQNKTSLVVESLIDKKRRPVTFRQQLSALKDIAIYTYDEEIPLKNIFKSIYDKENGLTSISIKASKQELLDYFREILPDFDEDRVYISTIKKIINWYNLLFNNKFDFKQLEINTKTDDKNKED